MSFLNVIATNITPFVALIFLAFFILFLYRYDKEVRGMLNRFGTDNQKLSNQDLIPTQDSTTPANDISINVKYESEEARVAGQVIHKILDSTSYSLEKKLDLVITDLSNKDIRLDFEVTCRAIFKSQFEALQSLKKDGSQPLGRFYDIFVERAEKIRADNPGVKIVDFETWIGFLSRKTHPFIIINGGSATITDRGSEFLSYTSAISFQALVL